MPIVGLHLDAACNVLRYQTATLGELQRRSDIRQDLPPHRYRTAPVTKLIKERIEPRRGQCRQLLAADEWSDVQA